MLSAHRKRPRNSYRMMPGHTIIWAMRWDGSGQLDQAVASYRRALMLNPGLAEAHNNLANALLGSWAPDRGSHELPPRTGN